MGDTAEAAAATELTFKVKSSGDVNHNVTISDGASVLDLKTKLAGDTFENIPVERQRLIYSGRVMKNDDKLSSYKIKQGNTVHLVKSAASNPAVAAAGSSATPAAPAVPTNMAAGTSAGNLLAGLTGARFAGHANLPSASTFGADGGMGAPPGEEEMANMLSNPHVASQLNEALNNPQIVDMMIQQDPMLRNMPNAREMINSPMFRQMMTNPDLIRQAATMRRAMNGGGAGAASAFPAPGATDTTPAGAATGGAAAGAATTTTGAAANPFGNPLAMGNLGSGNPFASLFGTPAAGATNPPTATGDNATATNPSANPFGSLFGGGGGGTVPGAGAGGFNLPPMTPETLQQMQQFMQQMGGAGGMFGGAPAPTGPPDTRPPEERYESQLRQLNDMGFFDFDQNVAALRRSGGSVQGAIEHLLSG